MKLEQEVLELVALLVDQVLMEWTDVVLSIVEADEME